MFRTNTIAMKTILCTFLVFSATVGFSQVMTKDCKQVSTQEFQVEKNYDFPEIENFKGDFQFIMGEASANKSFALSSQFFLFIEEQRKDFDEVTIEMGNGNTLVIAPLSVLDLEGNGPFEQPFIKK